MEVQVSAVKDYESDIFIYYITQEDKLTLTVTPDFPLSVVNMHKLKFNYQTNKDDEMGTEMKPAILAPVEFEVEMKPDDTWDMGFWEGLPGIKVAEMPKRYILRRD
ncbi:MAG: hypothetical protein KAJ39_00480 [Gammaproteobacteria bacterium]|nr:hypothetical protein [Gammaproteobacteria bacterium]